MSNQVGEAVYSHVMSNGVQLDIREVPGFGNRSEIGFFVKSKCIGTYVVDKRRGGNIEVRPTMMKQQRIGENINNNIDETIIPNDPKPSLSIDSTDD